MKRFPRLYERIHEIVARLLCERLQPTKRFVSDLVESEQAYINTKHTEFVGPNVLQSTSSGDKPPQASDQTPREQADFIMFGA